MAILCALSFAHPLLGAPARSLAQPNSGSQKLNGHVPAIARQLAPAGRLAPTTQLHLAIGLPIRDRAGLDALLRDLYNPASPNYRHWLTTDQFASRFGATEQDYQAVRDFARTNGLIVSGTYPNRLVVDIAGSVADMERVLHVTLHTYHHPTEKRDFFAPDVEPSLDLAVPVLHISGLDTFSLPHPASFHAKPLDLTAPRTPNDGSGPGGAYIGNDFRNAYMPGVSLTGSGQIVGLLEFDGYFPSDIAAYATQAGLNPIPLENVFVDGFNGNPGSANGEVALDIEVVMAMAPELSKIVVYQAPNPAPWVDIVSRMASDTQVKQFSSSWGGGTPDTAADQVFQQMAAQGQSFFNASGDGDAYTGDVPFPSDSPYVTSVGGTTLTTSTNGGAYVSEQVWNVGGGVGSSGGVSTTYPIPAYQQDVDMTANGGSSSLRNIPDVALTADNILIIADNGATENVGGTSAASPLWAAVTALANQQIAAGCGSSVGFLNPVIYGIGKSSGYNAEMNDIVKGDNTSPASPNKFKALTGYDLCTGWGSPKPAILGALGGPAQGALPVVVQPLSGSALISTDAQPIYVTISGVTNASVIATVSGSPNAIVFANDGQAPDLAANDSVYTGLLQLPAAPASVSVTIMATAPGRQGATNTFLYTVVPAALNDNFADATKVPVGGAVYQANNRYATTERGEPKHDGDAAAAASLWWAWTPTSNTSVLIDTAGSRVDNVLAVYTGASLSTLKPVAASSGAVSQIQPATVTFNAQAGQGYYIAVASSKSNSLGSVQLAIQPGLQADKTAPVVTVSGPQSGLTVSNKIVTVTGTASDAGANPTGVNKVVVTVNGCSSGSASGTTSWSANVSLQPELNVLQAIAYDEAGNASAPVTIELVYFAVTPGNDFLATAPPLIGLVGTNLIDTSNATKETGEPAHAGNAGGKSVWWSFSTAVDGVLTLNTEGSSFDTLLAVYTGSSVSSLTPVGSSDDAYPGAPGGFSYLNQAVHSNVIYYVALDGYGGASGSAVLTYSFTPAPLVHVSANVVGSGTVQLATVNQLGGRSIQPSGAADVAAGTTLVLTPAPSPDFRFSSWTGDVTSVSSPLSVVAKKNLGITAQFVPVVFSDDFESGSLQQLGWTTSGNAPWVIESTNVASGKFAVRSGVIGNNQSSSLILTTNFAESVGSFDYRVSSELNFDFFKFLIDGALIQQWSGQAGWATFSFPVPSGSHTLEWRYAKDPSGANGLDAAFIDNVTLPIVLPKNSTTAARLAWVQGSDGSFSISLSGQVNQQYILQTSTDLIHWQTVSTAAAPNGSLQINPGAFSSSAQFYRAVVP